MLQIPVLFSVLLLATGSCAVACTLYASQGTWKPARNKLLLCVAVCLLVWALGLGLRVSAADLRMARLASLLVPLGSGPLFGFLLHAVLLLTGTELSKGRRWLYLPIYLPGALAAFGLSVLPAMGLVPLALRRTALGWTDCTQNGWVLFCDIYYLLDVIVASVLLLRSVRRAKDRRQSRQAALLLGSILCMAVLGFLTGVLFDILGVPLPDMAAVFAILPILAICYTARFVRLTRPSEDEPDEIILNGASRTGWIYRLFGVFLLAGGVLCAVFAPLHGGADIRDMLLLGALLAGVGGGVFALNRLPQLDDKRKELILALLVAAMLPAVTLSFVSTGGVSVWPAFVLILILCMVFNRRILISTVVIAEAQTQLVLIAAAPQNQVDLGAWDAVVRISLIGMAGAACFAVSTVYRRRLCQNARHAARQAYAADVSQTLMLADTDNWDEIARKTLAHCCRLFQCEQAYFVPAFCAGDKPDVYAAEDLPENVEKARETDERRQRTAAAAVARLGGGDTCVCFAGDSSMDETLQGIMRENGFYSMVAATVRQKDMEAGALIVCSTHAGRQGWDADNLAFLHIVSNLFADTLTKLDAIRKVRYIACHDQLTGLPNRLLLKDRLDQAIPLAWRMSKMLGVIFLDLDSFKSVNDTMGHEIGDELLMLLGAGLSRNVRRYDTVARVGGDEFVLLINQISSTADLLRIVEKIMQVVRRPVVLRGQEFFMTVSAGVALYPQDGKDAEALISNADIAMYHAKSMGKNRYALCSQDMKDEIIGQMRMTNQLYRALERRQLMMYYQPQVSLETHSITGVEALLRWDLPGRGIVSPGVFIPLAEKAGLIPAIGEWVLETACRQCKEWQQKGFAPLRMAVNVSIQQLYAGDFLAQVKKALQTTGLDARCLELEVTESIANSGTPGLVRVFTALKEMGVSLSIDDFGTEYSSLRRLKLLPVDRLKLDIQFVRGLENSEKDRAITKAIISLAKSMNMKVVAEGVETDAQLAFLSQRMCDEVQGFYYFRPMPAEEVEKHLKPAGGENGAVWPACAADRQPGRG